MLLPAWQVRSATVVWSGASGTDTNWSNGANWADAAAPAAVDDVKFFDPGTNGVAGTPNNRVDAAFSGTIASLQYGQTNGFHTTVIDAGQTLNVTGTGGLSVFTPVDPGVAKTVSAAITGADGKVNLDNTSANLVLNQGQASAGGSKSILDMSGLGTFTANISRLGIGTTALPNPLNPGLTGVINQRMAGTLYLARTNVLTLNYTDTLANYQTANKTNALEMVRHPGNNSGTMSFLYLGITNAFFVDSLGIGRDKASASSAGWLGFNPAFAASNPVAYFRGAAGNDSRVTWWAVGDMDNSSSSSQVSVGTNDFSAGTVDALVDVMSLARDCAPSHTASASIVGVLTFAAGTIDVNTLLVGNQALGTSGSTTPLKGFVNVNGPAATLVVNSNLILGSTVQSSTAAANTSGTLSIRNGTVRANTISVGAASTVNVVSMTNGTLVLSNTLASPARALTTFNLTNSVLQLNITGVTNIVVTNLVTGGATNIIKPAAVDVFASYPAQVSLIKYSGSIGGAGFNFGFGDNALPLSASGAYLSNNVDSTSIDLVLPTDPRPVVTSTSPNYSGAPGDNVSFSVTWTGVEPAAFQWYKGSVAVADGPTGSGSTVAGAQTSTLSINGAQEADSGNYSVVIGNSFGSTTSAPPNVLTISLGDIPPLVTGPSDETVIQGNDVTLTAAVSGKPAPSLQWRKNGQELPGETAASLTIVNAQYPADQTTYSLVASNAAGVVTNSAFLTVIVRPTIDVPPTALVVTNTQLASFSVTASGVPAPSYQWLKNGGQIPGQTGSTFTIASASPSDIATYSVVVSNAAGTVTSDPVTLIVNSTMAAMTLVPADGATGIGYDTPLYVTFSQAPVLRKAGKIRIYNATNSTTPVDTIDLSLNVDSNPTYAANVQPRAIGGEVFATFPVIIKGNTAAIYPHLGVLASNQTYYVTVDNGAFADAAGAYFAGITSSATWQFTTKPTGPADPLKLVVAADGSGDFVTVQGAIDSVPANNGTPVMIEIREGLYTELVNINTRHKLTLRGQSRNGAVIAYPNNNNANPGTHIRMSFKVNADDIVLDNLTLTNSTPKGGGQAEALMIETGRKRFVANNVTIASFQDTILANTSGTQGYFYNSLIQGDTDFIWGGGNLFFTNCEIKALSNGGHITQPRTDVGSNGMSFVNCALTRAAGVTSFDLGRSIGIPNGNAVFVTCLMDDHLWGWAADALPTSSFRYWDYSNSNLTATAVRTLTNSTTLASDDPNLAKARNATLWLYGWQPQLAPNIVTQPTNQSFFAGQTATLTVVATGIPDPTYQWQRSGTNVPGQTSATLMIPNAQVSDSGAYSVVVSNVGGDVPSSPATLTIVNSVNPPLISSAAFVDGRFTFTFSGDVGADYAVQASTNLVDWDTLFTTNSPASPFTWADPNGDNFLLRFYRIKVGPPLP